jgi:DNA-binding transcriptional LysR family regulator/anti-sigma regulatory factor (Ser/Thr protein kinase)
MLDVRRMRVLREVAERGSIAGAAQALAFTPSAVSQQIATLEREAGVALVERGPRSIRLTAAGRALVEHTEGILASLAAAEADIQAIAGVRGGMLRLASFPTAYATIMPAAIGEFRRRHPGVELTLTEADPLLSIARLKSGEIDLALLYEYDYVPLPDDEAVSREPLLDDPIRILLPRGHREARRRAVPLDALAAERWITSTARSSCHEFVARSCRASGFEADIGFESDDHGVWQGLVAAGVGVALAALAALIANQTGIGGGASLLGVLALLAAAALHALVYVLLKRDAGAISPLTLNALPMGLAGLLLSEDSRLEHELLDAREGLTVLGNLVDNALDAAAAGERRPPLVRVHLDDEAGALLVRVRDTGAGVPAAARTAVFEPGYSTKGGDGRGVGLSLVRQLVERRGGWVEVEDASDGCGAVFTAWLPEAVRPDVGAPT